MNPRLYELAEKYSSDKLYWHSYIPTYISLFENLEVKRLLEIGIGFRDLMQPFLPKDVEYVHGSSLKMWEEYFPGADIFGCDIREDALFNEGRIRTDILNQSSMSDIFRMLEVFKSKPFDVIIDDGSHLYEDQRLTASVLLHEVRKGGLYVIEDCWIDGAARLAEEFGGSIIQGAYGRDDNMWVKWL